MKKLLKNAVKYILAFGIAGFLIWWSLHGLSLQDKEDIKYAMLSANYLYILPVFILLLLSHWFRSLRWQQIIEPLGHKPPAFILLCALLIGYTANQLIPRAGELVRCTVVARHEKIHVEKLIGTVIAERSLDMICIAILGILTFFLEYDHIHAFTTELFTAFKIYLQNGITAWHITIVVLSAAAIATFIYILRKRKRGWGQYIIQIFKGIGEGLLSFRKIKNRFSFTVYTVLIWCCYTTATWVGCYAIQQTAHLQIGASLVMLITGTFGIIIAPGGLGAYPYAIQKTLLLYGINKNIALAFGWLLWLVQFAFTIIFGVLAFIAINLLNKKYAKHNIGTA